MNSKSSTLTRKFLIFSILLTLVLGSLGMAGTTSASAQELPPQTPSGEPAHYLVDEAGNVRLNPVPFAKTASAPAATSPSAACTKAPTLVSPANGSTLNTLIPELQWNTVGEPNATGIRVVWSKNADFSNWSSVTGWFVFTDWQISYNLEPATTYYWRAQFLCGEAREDGPLSAVWSFTTGSGGIVPVATILLAPANGSTVIAPVIFEWQPVSGATFYKVMYREVGQMGYGYDILDETSLEVWWLDADIEYEWWVQAGSGYAFGPSSATWTFELVEPTFPDVPGNYWAVSYIERLYNAGLTGGYPDGTYRPANTVTRAEMAIFLMKGMNGPAYTPPTVSPTFTDTDSHWAANWIEALKTAGLTGGYPDGTYRPNSPVTRAEMAIFLLKAMNGAAYTPPAASPTFSDTAEHWAANWIEALKAAGITSGYPDGTYRPGNYVTRAEMAVFLVKAFGLP